MLCECLKKLVFDTFSKFYYLSKQLGIAFVFTDLIGDKGGGGGGVGSHLVSLPTLRAPP